MILASTPFLALETKNIEINYAEKFRCLILSRDVLGWFYISPHSYGGFDTIVTYIREWNGESF